ncbi:MAG: hypothetical protein ACQETH_05905 [Candidatus Rifleibacteriota bacterium]
MKRKYFFIICIFLLVSYQALFAANSICQKFDDVSGSGKYPFNFRAIDNRLFAGGFLFNPINKDNSDQKVRQFLKLLAEFNVKTLILLHVPAGEDPFTTRLEALCRLENLNLMKMRMNAVEVPDEIETRKIMQAVDNGAYVHCMWGCDRTGAIIGRYLVDRMKYEPEDAYRAIIKSGSHSGKKGGFKEIKGNQKLLLYFWPEVAEQSPEIWQKFK